MKIYLATHNANKVREFQALVSGTSQIKFLSIPQDISWDETGDTFYANAKIKADAVSKVFPKDWVLADDSGLCVEALNGEPGVYSARYAGENATDAENRQKLLRALAHEKDRRAYYMCCLVLQKGTEEVQFYGKCAGAISTLEVGSNGFGYDSIFVPEGYTATFAELDLATKNKISHRARALIQLNAVD